jgi:hypothetical protein
MIMTTAEKQEQQGKMANTCSIAQSLFLSECAREGIPSNEEESRKLIDKCFTASQTMIDYLRDKFEPFI